MKLRANRAMEYGHRSLRAGDIFNAESELDARILTTVPPGALQVIPPASLVEDKDAEESSSGRDPIPHQAGEENEPPTEKAPRGRPRRRAQAKAHQKVTRRTYRRRDMEAEKNIGIVPETAGGSIPDEPDEA